MKKPIVSDRKHSENSESVIRIEIQPMGLEMEQELHINFKN